MWNRCFCKDLAVPQITFTISADNILSVDATDLDSGRHYTWQTTGGALIANGVNAAMLRDGVLPYSTLTGTQVSAAHEIVLPAAVGSFGPDSQAGLETLQSCIDVFVSCGAACCCRHRSSSNCSSH